MQYSTSYDLCQVSDVGVVCYTAAMRQHIELTERLIVLIGDDAAYGVPPATSAMAHGVPPARFLAWWRTGMADLDADRESVEADLVQTVQAAQGTGLIRLHKAVVAQADEDWRAAAFILKAADPGTYDRKALVAAGGAQVSLTVQMNQIAAIQARLADAGDQGMAAIDAEILKQLAADHDPPPDSGPVD